MKYTITRTSDDFGQHSPYLGAVYEGKDEWNQNIWSINIESLSDLNEIVRQTGSPIILDKNHIEIYDDYRE